MSSICDFTRVSMSGDSLLFEELHCAHILAKVIENEVDFTLAGDDLNAAAIALTKSTPFLNVN
jgi:hypothetical protein